MDLMVAGVNPAGRECPVARLFAPVPAKFSSAQLVACGAMQGQMRWETQQERKSRGIGEGVGGLPVGMHECAQR